MASTYSLRFRLNYQAPGDNLNIWGVVLNTGVFQLLEDAMAKRVAFTLSGAKTLTTVNGAADEARSAFLDVTGGTGGTITIPSLEKVYLVRNGASGDVIVSTGGGVTSTLEPTEISFVVCDGTNVRTIGFNGAGFKQYVDDTAWAYNAGSLPAQAGAAGKYLGTNGTVASWNSLTQADVVGLFATTAQARAGTSLTVALSPGDVTAAQAPVALTYGATVTPDMSAGKRRTLTASASFNMGAPTNAAPGDVLEVDITNSAGSIVLAVNAAWKRQGGLGIIAPNNAERSKFIGIIEEVDGSGNMTRGVYNIIRNPT